MRFIARYVIYPPIACVLWGVFLLCVGIAAVERLITRDAI